VSKRGFQGRNGFAGTIFNSMVVNTTSEEGFEIDADSAMTGSSPDCPAGSTEDGLPASNREGAPCFAAEDNVNNTQQPWASTSAGLTRLVCSTLDDTGTLDTDETSALTDGNALSESLRGLSPTTTADDNVTSGFSNLLNEDQTFDPQGDANGKLTVGVKLNLLNPRPQGFTGTSGCVGPQFPGGDVNATYRGAFPATGSINLWTTPWSVMNDRVVVD
jgi:hypothetical protein